MLSNNEFQNIIKLTPLIAMDLIIIYKKNIIGKKIKSTC